MRLSGKLTNSGVLSFTSKTCIERVANPNRAGFPESVTCSCRTIPLPLESSLSSEARAVTLPEESPIINSETLSPEMEYLKRLVPSSSVAATAMIKLSAGEFSSISAV